jgi:hypothetical protein
MAGFWGILKFVSNPSYPSGKQAIPEPENNKILRFINLTHFLLHYAADRPGCVPMKVMDS